jgi:hypothetical protein
LCSKLSLLDIKEIWRFSRLFPSILHAFYGIKYDRQPAGCMNHSALCNTLWTTDSNHTPKENSVFPNFSCNTPLTKSVSLNDLKIIYLFSGKTLLCITAHAHIKNHHCQTCDQQQVGIHSNNHETPCCFIWNKILILVVMNLKLR